MPQIHMKSLSIYQCHTLPRKLQLPSLEMWADICINHPTGYMLPTNGNKFEYASKGISYKSIIPVCRARSKTGVEEEYKIDCAQVVDIGSTGLAEGTDVIAMLGVCKIYTRKDLLYNKIVATNFTYSESPHRPVYAFAYQPFIYYWQNHFWTDAVDNLNIPVIHRTTKKGSNIILKYNVIYPLINEDNDGQD
jgi:hypothetical protein